MPFCRELAGEADYIVIVNLAGAEETVDLSVFAAFPNELFVATAAPNSRYSVG